VEVALVRLNPEGKITEEWETLVHPGQPIPNAHIHGIDDALVTGAPRLAEIAGTLAAKLHEHVDVAHNLRSFDGPIPEALFAEVDGIDLSLGTGVDTMPTPRMKLVELCATFMGLTPPATSGSSPAHRRQPTACGGTPPAGCP
jgi:DNA polymerase III alpha subunit (gram-positive type)